MAFLHPLSEDGIRSVLQTIQDPYLGQDLVTAKILKRVSIEGGLVTLSLKLNYPVMGYQETMRQLIETALLSLPGVSKVQTTINWNVNSHLAQKGIKGLTNLKNIIAVASGKGGVGKSTTAVNLALAMQAEGAKVGLLDADIYGPSQALLLGAAEKPIVREDKRMEPVVRYGLQSMSMGYLVGENTPTVWRGPMVSQALQQLLHETAWNDLDYLIVDLPPGTGDIQLTLAQKIPVSGAVIVTTPQDIALLDAKKALAMFRKLDISVLGVVENMSVHICSKCGHHEPIFGSLGGQQMATDYEVPLLGQLPLDIRIREQTDLGVPIVVSDPQGQIAGLYREMARHVTAKLSLRARDYNAVFPVVS
jgi:ATP-binding protein involved in chromosome partitioning